MALMLYARSSCPQLEPRDNKSAQQSDLRRETLFQTSLQWLTPDIYRTPPDEIEFDLARSLGACKGLQRQEKAKDPKICF